MDYRYFPDPDLLPLAISNEMIASIKAAMPELPQAMRLRFEQQYGLSAYDAVTLTSNQALAAYFEAVVKDGAADEAGTSGANGATGTLDPKSAANWVMGEISGRLNDSSILLTEAPVSPAALAGLLRRIADGTISGKIAKEVFAAMWAEGGRNAQAADSIIEARGLKQISDSGAIEKIVDEVIAANPKSVEEFRSGKEKAFNALVGQVMKGSRGKANPAQVNEVLKRKLRG